MTPPHTLIRVWLPHTSSVTLPACKYYLIGQSLWSPPPPLQMVIVAHKQRFDSSFILVSLGILTFLFISLVDVA